MLFSLVLGCTLQAGHGFGAISKATLSVGLVPGVARDLGDNTVLTDLGYEVHLDSLQATLTSLDLQELTGGVGGSFDPANPPAGYTLCHGGHCHAEDGSLVDYAEVEAELAGGAASFVSRVSLGVGDGVDLLSGQVLELPLPSQDLAAGDLSLLWLGVEEVSFDGSVLKGEQTWEVSGTLPAGATTSGIEVGLGRGEAPVLELAASWTLDGTLFDGLDFETLFPEGGGVWSSLEDSGAADFVASVLANEPELAVTRSDW